MKKRLPAIILALTLCFGSAAPAYAADPLPVAQHHRTFLGILLEGFGLTAEDTLATAEEMADTAEDTPATAEDTPVVYQPVELVLQMPQLPNGCEVTSLAMALASAGYPINNLDLYKTYMPTGSIYTYGGKRYGPDPEEYYVGDATSSSGGWYCFEGPVIETANAWLDHNESGLAASKISGLSQDELDEYAQAGIPVVVWVTLTYGAPRRSSYTWRLPDGTVYKPYVNLHCVLLAGMEDGKYRIADPLTGWRTMGRSQFWNCFDAMGRRAVVIGRAADAPDEAA